MINGLEGIPGSGKSYEAAVYHVLPALQAGRLVITNLPLVVEMFAAINPDYRKLLELRRRTQPIRGTWDANRVDDQGNGSAFELFEDGRTEKPDVKVPLFGHVWDYWSEWKHPKTGQGPLFIIDECHVGMPKLGTDSQVIEWYKLHRHFNADVLLGTQNFRDMNPSIAGLLAILIKVRKADILGRSGSYIRKVHAGYRGAVIATEEREYQSQYFSLYKSHTQGNSVVEAAAQDVAPFIVKFKRYTRLVLFLALVGMVYVGWRGYQAYRAPKVQTVKTISMGPPPGYVPPRALPIAKPAPVATAAAALAQPEAFDDIAEPYQGKGLHLNGFLTMKGYDGVMRTVYLISVSQNGIVVSRVTDAELARAGYRYKPLSDCAGVVQWRNKNRSITCDTPQTGIATSASGETRG
jgi:zona occludens toxin